MKSKLTLSYIGKRLIPGVLWTLIISSLFIVGAVKSLKMENIWMAAGVTQIGLALLWITIRWGLFSTTSYGTRRYIKSNIERKHKKIGVYEPEKKEFKNKLVEYDSPREIVQKNKGKSYLSIWFMIAIGIIELIVGFAAF